jgi:HD-GYP domain-containing protein (c-di-GMP phosphodiesterase class II)
MQNARDRGAEMDRSAHPALDRPRKSARPSGFPCAALNQNSLRADTSDVRTAPSLVPESVRVSDVLSALSFALDLTEGQPMGHALRACLIGMHLGDTLRLSITEQRDLYYALLLKDAGCSSNSARVFELFGGDDRIAKHDLMRVDWANYFKAARYAMAHASPGASWFERMRRVASLAKAGEKAAIELIETRCVRGADIVERLGFGHRAAEAVRNLDEHWDGGGHPRGLSGSEIPLLSRILCVAQTLEAFAVIDGPRGALALVKRRSGRWFDPMLIDACAGLEELLATWCTLDETGLREAVRDREPGGAALLAGPGTLDRIAHGFADVVDAKSPFTSQHSRRMTDVSVQIADELGMTPGSRAALKRAALLHDIGKLSVPNSILDKPGPLNAAEWEVVRMHPYYTLRILTHIRGFDALAQTAAAHHERIDGTGYFRGLSGDQISRESRILATADVYDALTTARPYRPALPEEVALRLMEKDRGCGLDGDCLDALSRTLERSEPGREQRAA